MTHKGDDSLLVDAGLHDRRGIDPGLLVGRTQNLMLRLMETIDVRQHVFGVEHHIAILTLPMLKRYVDLSELLEVILRNFGRLGDHPGTVPD